MKNKSKILFALAALSILTFCVIFVFNTQNISSWISALNGNNPKIDCENIISVRTDSQQNTKLVNTPAMGKYKINLSNKPVGGYTTINANSLHQRCLEIINSNGKVTLISCKDNLDNEYFVAILQMLAGDDYEHILSYFKSNFKGTDEEAIKNSFDNYYSELFKLNTNDIPYINLKIPASKYLENNGLSNTQINQLIEKLKENCEK